MNDTYIVTAYVVIDDVLKAYGFVDDSRATGTAAEILTVGVIAAKYFQNHHERALCVMTAQTSGSCIQTPTIRAKCKRVMGMVTVGRRWESE
jgi:hypothetical protein